MKKTTTVIAALLMFGSAANASTGSLGYVSDIHSIGGGIILFTQSGSRTATPACATINVRWAFNGSTPEGQNKLAILLTAYALHKPMYVQGTDACGLWGDTETVNFFATQT